MEEFLTQAVPFAKNHTLLVGAWVAIFVATIYTFIKSALSKVTLVSNSEATALINNQNAVLIDLRSIDEFKRGHIVNSLQFLPTDIKNHNIGKLEQHKDTPVILVDATGVVARASAEILAKQGFNHVYALNEGIAGWNAANLPLVK